jgi:hypothetical protein
MSIYESPSTPAALVRYLATYITDDSAIVAHIKHRFDVEWTKDDIAKMRSSLPRKYMQGQGKPSAWDSKSDTDYRGPKPRRDDPLLRALAKYHLKRAKTHEEIKHWGALAK